MIWIYLAGVVLFGAYLIYLVCTDEGTVDAFDVIGLIVAAFCWPVTLPLYVLTYVIAWWFEEYD